MSIRIAAVSDQGGRPRNEDAWRVHCLGNAVFLVLCDGLGGHPAGHVASRIAVEAALAAYPERSKLPLPEAASACVDAAQDALASAIQQGAAPSMRTTLCLLLIRDGQAVYAWIGDSRLYWIRGGAILCRTADHSVAQALVAAGEIPPEALPAHEDRHQLTRALGMEQPRFCVSEPQSVLPGDRFLLCSDGWWETLSEEALLAQAPTPGAWLQSMRPETGDDNRTAVAVHIEEGDASYAVETL